MTRPQFDPKLASCRRRNPRRSVEELENEMNRENNRNPRSSNGPRSKVEKFSLELTFEKNDKGSIVFEKHIEAKT